MTDMSTFCLIWDQTVLSGFLFSEWEDSVLLLTVRKKTQVELSANAHIMYVHLQPAENKIISGF